MSVRVGARIAPSTGVRKLRRPVATSAPSFNPLTDWTTDPVHAVWASDPLWTPPADGGAVSSWRNGGSVGTPNFTQATGTKQPTYRASTAAYNNKPTVQFDGTDDVLWFSPANIAQPYFLVAIANTGGVDGNFDLIIGLGGFTNGIGDNTSNLWILQAGGAFGAGTSNASPHLFFGKLSGAASVLAVDGTTVATGNAGTDAIVDIGLGASNNAGTFHNYLVGHIAYAAVFTTDPTGQAEWASFKAWVTSTYGIAVA